MGRRLSADRVLLVENALQQGRKTQAEIASEFGVSRRTVQKYAARMTVAEPIGGRGDPDASKGVADTGLRLGRWLDRVVSDGEGGRYNAKEIRSLNLAADTFLKLQRAALASDSDEALPEIVVRRLTAIEIEEIRESQKVIKGVDPMSAEDNSTRC